MVSVPFFKCRVTKTDVGLLRLRGGDLCLVNNVPLFAISFKWTRVLISAITVADFSSHNKAQISKPVNPSEEISNCNCRNKNSCPLEGNCKEF